MPVFSQNSPSKVFKKGGARPEKISVYFMRKHIVEQSGGKVYSSQEKLVKDEGFEVTPLRERVLYDVLTILQSGTCPDVHNPSTYARNSDAVRYGNTVYRSFVGNSGPHVGVRIDDCPDSYDDECIGVAPGVSAEVLPAVGT